MGAGDPAQDSPHQHLQDDKKYRPGRQVSNAKHPYQQCCGSMKFWYGSGSADPYLVSNLTSYFLKVHLHNFSKMKSHKEVAIQYFCLMIEGPGSISLAKGSGFGTGRPKNMRILRIRIQIRISNTAY